MNFVERHIYQNKSARWGKAVLIADGGVWILRAGLEVVFRPDYWNPRTVVDYTVVAGFSLALVLLALGLWAVHLGRRSQRGISKWVWNVGIGLACAGAAAAGGANFLEDWLGIKQFGDLFVWGSLALFVGLLLAGIGAMRAADLSRWTAWLLFACALGMGMFDLGGGFIVGTALILLGVLNWD